MRIFFTISYILIISILTFAQQSNIDSLQRALSNSTSPEDKLNILLELGNIFLDNNLPKAKSTIEEAETLANDINDSISIAKVNLLFGRYYQSISDYEKAATKLLKSISIAEKLSLKDIEKNSLNVLAVVYSRTNNFEKANEIFLKLLQLTKGEKSDDFTKYTLNYSTFLASFGKINEAEKQLHDILPSIKNSFYKAVALNILSFLSNTQNKYSEAIKFAKQALEVDSNYVDTILRLEILTNLANAYYGLKNYDESISINNRILQLADEHNLQLQKDNAFGNLYLNYEAKGDYKKALNYFKKYYELKDSLVNADISNKVNELNIKYETEKKESQLREKDNLLAFNQKLQKIYLLILVLVVFSLGSFVYLWYKKKAAYKFLVDVNLDIINEEMNVHSIKTKIINALGKENKIEMPEEENTSENKERKNISNELKIEILNKINQMIENKDYLNQDFSLELMASNFHTNTKYISQIIHQTFDSNFANFINRLRINEACLLLIDDKYKNYSIEGIGQSVGFSSKQAFYTAFKKFTGLTPTYYRMNANIQKKAASA